MLSHFHAFIRRFMNSWRLGFILIRRSQFVLPSQIKINKQFITLSHPSDSGVKNDFLTCMVEDEYGLYQLPDSIQSVLDIGANVGFFSLSARSRFPHAKIHSYEPNLRTFTYLQKNTSELNIQCFQEAVGTTDGWVQLIDSGDSNQTRTHHSSLPSEIAQISFQKTLERLGGFVDLVKIDCEGAEWDLFEDQNSWKNFKFLRMEYHLWGKHTFDEVASHLERLNFKITTHHSSGEWGTVWAESRAFLPKN